MGNEEDEDDFEDDFGIVEHDDVVLTDWEPQFTGDREKQAAGAVACAILGHTASDTLGISIGGETVEKCQRCGAIRFVRLIRHGRWRRSWYR